jgi:predicted NBD/HSP70 family sugar kinase
MAFTSNHTDLRHINRLAVINLVKKQPGFSRADIAKHTGLNKSTIGKIVQELLDEHWLSEDDAPTPLEGAGRRPTGLTLNGDVLTLLGAEIGVDFITVLACSITGELRFNATLPYTHTDIDASLDQLTDILAHAWQLMLGMNHQVLGLGISVPGMVNAVDEHVVDLPNLDWHDLDLIALLRERFTRRDMPTWPITVINDANAAALSEFVFGRSQFSRNPIVHLTMGVGVGAGIVSETGLYHGYNGWAGELGHSILQPIDGRLCACGQRGCVETLVSQRALSRAIVGDEPMLSIETMQRRLAQGDAQVKAGLDTVGHYLGIVLRNIANILNPETIVIGGPMSQFENDLIAPTLASFKAHTARNKILPNIRLCEFGQHASALGAAAAVLTKHVEPEGTPLHLRHQGLLRK